MTMEPQAPDGVPLPEQPPAAPAEQAGKGPSLGRQVAGAMMWNVLLFPLKFAVGVVAGLVVPNLLGKERFSLYILITSVAATLGTYVDLGMERSLPRYIPEVAKRFGAHGLRRFLREVLSIKLGLLVLLIVVFNLFSSPLIGYMRSTEVQRLGTAQSSLLKETDPAKRDDLAKEIAGHQSLIARLDSEGYLYLLAISAMLLLSVIYDLCMRLLVAYFRQRASNTIDLAMAIIQPALIIGLVYLGWDVKGVLVALVVTPVVGVLMAWWRMSHAVSRLPATGEEVYDRPRQVWPRFLSFTGVSYLVNLSTWLYDLAFLSLVAAACLSTLDVGTLGVASKFVSLFLGYLVIPLTGIQVPLFAHLYARKGEGDVQGAFGVLSQFLLLLLVPTGAGLALLAPSLMPLLYPGYPSETTTLVLVFIVAMFLETLVGTPQQMLLVYERYGIVIIARLAALVVVPLLLVLMPPYGLLGAAVAAGIARLLSRGITFVYGLRYFPLRFPWRFAGRVAGGVAAMLAVLYPLTCWLHIDQVGAGWAGKLPTLGKDLALAGLGAVIFWTVFRLLGGLERDAKKRLADMQFPLKGPVLWLAGVGVPGRPPQGERRAVEAARAREEEVPARSGPEKPWWKDWPRLLVILLIIGLVIRMVFACLPLKQLLILLEDDAWMVTAIARNLAIGHGISADGLNPTNGFHPLYPLTLGAIPYLVAPNALDAGFRVNLIFCALLGTAAAIPLFRLTRRFAGQNAGLLAAAIYLVNPYFARVTVNAMETSTGLLLLLLLADRFFTFDRRNWKAALILGLLAGLSGLARLDDWILAAMLGVALLWEWGRGAPRARTLAQGQGGEAARRTASFPTLVAYGAGVAALALPYFAWNYAVFGSLGPSSGRALSYMHSYANGFSLTNILHFFYLNPALDLEFLPSTVLALVVVLLVVAAYLWLLPRWVRRALLPLAGYVILELLYYAYLLQNSNPRYFFGPAAFFCVLVGVVYGRFEQRLRPAPRRALVAAVLLAFVGLNTYEPINTYRVSSRMPQLTQPAIYEAALWVRDNLPAGVLLASKNSGLMQYYSGHVVLNADGKLNGEIVPVLVRRQLLAYLKGKGVVYLVDREEAISRHIALYSEEFGLWPAHQEVSALQKVRIYAQLLLSQLHLAAAPALDDPSGFRPSRPFSDVADVIQTFPRPNTADDPVVVFRLR